MKFYFDAFKDLRLKLINFFDELDYDKLNKIPDKFNNNVLWNLGHILTSQQLLCYKLAGAGSEMIIPDSYIIYYVRGSDPKNWDTEMDMKELKSLFKKSTDAMEKDYEAGKLSDYFGFQTSSGLELNTIEDAIVYNYGHENLHYGVINSIIKFL